MTTTLSKWGNSFGLRLSKKILAASGITEKDNINIIVEEGKIIITKAYPSSIKELFAGYESNEPQKEIDWGEPQGGEIW